MSQRTSVGSVIVVLLSLVLGAPLGAQIARGAPQDGATKLQSPLKISLSVGGQPYEFSGFGRCTYAPGAALLNRPGANWVVQVKPAVTTGLRSFGLTVWRLSGEPSSMFELYLVIDRSDKRISTMNGRTNNGSGAVVLTPRDSGGVFTIDGKTQGGVDIHATVDCERFRLPSSAVGR